MASTLAPVVCAGKYSRGHAQPPRLPLNQCTHPIRSTYTSVLLMAQHCTCTSYIAKLKLLHLKEKPRLRATPNHKHTALDPALHYNTTNKTQSYLQYSVSLPSKGHPTTNFPKTNVPLPSSLASIQDLNPTCSHLQESPESSLSLKPVLR